METDMTRSSEDGRIDRRETTDSGRVSSNLIYLSFSLLFAVLVFLVWVIADFGIAERVVITSLCIPLLIQAAIKIVAMDGERRREE
jgi:hypothetical protein